MNADRRRNRYRSRGGRVCLAVDPVHQALADFAKGGKRSISYVALEERANSYLAAGTPLHPGTMCAVLSRLARSLGGIMHDGEHVHVATAYEWSLADARRAYREASHHGARQEPKPLPVPYTPAAPQALANLIPVLDEQGVLVAYVRRSES